MWGEGGGAACTHRVSALLPARSDVVSLRITTAAATLTSAHRTVLCMPSYTANVARLHALLQYPAELYVKRAAIYQAQHHMPYVSSAQRYISSSKCSTIYKYPVSSAALDIKCSTLHQALASKWGTTYHGTLARNSLLVSVATQRYL